MAPRTFDLHALRHRLRSAKIGDHIRELAYTTLALTRKEDSVAC